MIKIVFCLIRAPGLTREAFQDYWRHRHAPLVMQHAATLGIRRYVQSHRLFDPALDGLSKYRGGSAPEYDGVAELWFDSVDAMLGPDSAQDAVIAAGRALLADEGEFIDLARSPIFVAQEHEIISL